ncbi:S41 family peptidase [Candidatus Gracilibacteria bacterium]|nr:S41 family peptidase [Candidatus Gracilibacteria bacterium]
MKKIFIVFLTSFILGALVSFQIANIYFPQLGKTQEYSLNTNNRSLDMTEFWDVYSIIDEEYFSAGDVQKSDLVEGAIAGMVSALGDKHTEFMNPEINKKFNEALSGDFEGIGAVVEKVPLGVLVERILKGSPAKIYDIRAGDIIIQVDGETISELDLYDAVEKIKGPAGSQVTLTLLRPESESTLDISVVRDKIHIPSIEQKFFEEDNIGYIALNLFGDTTAEEFSKALADVQAAGVDGLIIDLRDNGGGFLQSAVQILSEFIPEGEVLVKTRYKDSFFDQSYFSIGSESLFEKKIVVLINGNSASASEITAGALKDYDKAILVGEKSYGKGSVQQPFDLEDGSMLKLTVAKWFTPKGVNIDAEGIVPDIEVNFEEADYEDKYDRQLETAKEVLKSYIEKNSIGLTVEQYEKNKIETGTGEVIKED